MYDYEEVDQDDQAESDEPRPEGEKLELDYAEVNEAIAAERALNRPVGKVEEVMDADRIRTILSYPRNDSDMFIVGADRCGSCLKLKNTCDGLASTISEHSIYYINQESEAYRALTDNFGQDSIEFSSSNPRSIFVRNGEINGKHS